MARRTDLRPARTMALAIGAVVALLASGCSARITGGGQTAPLTSFSGGSTAAGTSGTTDGAGTSGTAPGTAPGAGSSGAAGSLATLDGSARSVQTTAVLTGLSSVHLSGASVLMATGDVVDRTGRDLGTGSLRASDSNVTVSASGASMQLASLLRVQPGAVTVNDGISGSIGVSFSGSATITASSLTFQPPPPAAPVTTPPAPGSPSTVAPTTTVPPPVAVAGPVTLKANGLQIAGSALTLVNPPTLLTVASPEADLSWAGSGSITTTQGTFQATYLGVRAQELQATLQRSGGAVAVRGTGLALQAYANGTPQLQVQARIDILSTGATTGFLHVRPAFVWTPRNLDALHDMAILSIHPGNAAARGVHLGLLPMPAMFGGEPHALVGGDTTGLKGGDAIDSLIARNGNDKRSIGYDASPGVPLILVVQGNFAPITVTVTAY